MTLWTPTQDELAKLDLILGSIRGRKVGLLGLGVAGRAMADLLLANGAQVVAADLRPDLCHDTTLPSQLTLRLGPMDENTFHDVEALVISPGAHPEQPAVASFRNLQRPVLGELELVGKLNSKTIAITGTNGKSTTTALIGALVRGLGYSVFVGGNLGDPLSGFVAAGDTADVMVLELSSFQLETAYRYGPDVSVVLNVTPDHGERYDDIEDYSRAKMRILSSQLPSQTAVLNADDRRVNAMARETSAAVLRFSGAGTLAGEDGLFLVGENAKGSGQFTTQLSLSLGHEKLFGRHNLENAMAALLAVHALDLPECTWERLLEQYRTFAGLEHRLEWVSEIAGTRFINDSKATNDESAAVAVRALGSPLVVLVGGRSKGGGYEALVEACATKEVHVIAFGEAGAEIVERFAKQGIPVTHCTAFLSAIEQASSRAKPGTTVVLAPACSSFDEFSNYAERGRAFKAAVHALTQRAAL